MTANASLTSETLAQWHQHLRQLRNHCDGHQIQHIQGMASDLVTALSESPDKTYGTLLIHARHWPPSEAFALLCALNTAQLCQHQRWNQLAATQLVSAALCLSPKGPKKDVLVVLKQVAQPLWYGNLSVVARLIPHRQKAAFWPALHKLSESSRILMLASLLSLSQLNTARTLDISLNGLTRRLPTAFYPMLEQWLCYPSLLPPGSIVIDSNGQAGLVLSMTSQQHLVKELPDDEITSDGLNVWMDKTMLRPVAEPPLCPIDTCEQLWQQQWQQDCEGKDLSGHSKAGTAPVSRPPAKLVAIQKLLDRPQVNVDTVAEHIATEGFLAHQLTYRASQNSRMRLQVKEVKHALLFEGFERTRHLLLQQAFINRLNQHFYPLQHSLLQLTVLIAETLNVLATESGTLMAEEATTLGYFTCGGLFTCPRFKRMQKLPGPGEHGFYLDHFVSLPETQFTEHSVKLARSWGLPKSFVSAIDQHSRMPGQRSSKAISQPASLIGLALTLSRGAYFPSDIASEQTEQYTEQACHELGLTVSGLKPLQSEALSRAGCYCPC